MRTAAPVPRRPAGHVAQRLEEGLTTLYDIHGCGHLEAWFRPYHGRTRRPLSSPPSQHDSRAPNCTNRLWNRNDAHAIVRAGVRVLLSAQEGPEVVGEAADGRETLRLARLVQPHVVLMDLTMPEMTGLEATRKELKLAPRTRALILTMHSSDEFFFRALETGASGYLLKGAAPADLVTAVRSVHAGRVFLYPALAWRLLDEYLCRATRGEEQATYARLSERERGDPAPHRRGVHQLAHV